MWVHYSITLHYTTLQSISFHFITKHISPLPDILIQVTINVREASPVVNHYVKPLNNWCMNLITLNYPAWCGAPPAVLFSPRLDTRSLTKTIHWSISLSSVSAASGVYSRLRATWSENREHLRPRSPWYARANIVSRVRHKNRRSSWK